MTTHLTLNSKHPLQRARQLADRARDFDARGEKSNAEACRRRAFAWLQRAQPAPDQWILDQLITLQEGA